MKKSIIKVFSVILVVVLTLTSAPLSGFVGLQLPEWLDFSIVSKAAETSGTCGTNLTWNYDNSTKTLIISGTGYMFYYDENNYPWESHKQNVNIILVDSGVMSIGGKAFRGFRNLTKIVVNGDNQYYSSDEFGVLFNKDKTTLIQYPIGNDRTVYSIPNTVLTLNNLAFANCTYLVKVILPDSVISICDSTFFNCKNLTSITLCNEIESIGFSAFWCCSRLTDVYYNGTEEQWNKIDIDNYGNCNDELLNATIHFNSVGRMALIVAECEVGNIIEFGSYPQSEVTDESLLAELNSLELDWISYGYYSGTGDLTDGKMTLGDYMKYADVIYYSNKYRAVKFTEYRPCYTGNTTASGDTFQDDNEYYINTVYWFKYEPLMWRVLDPNEGFILCETIIDSQPYNNTIYFNSSDSKYYQNSNCTNYANDYATSSIRFWLNNDFYNTAFNNVEKNEILQSEQNNNCSSSRYPQYNSNITNDKVFLISYNEATANEYGFSVSTDDDDSRITYGTDYAKAQGLNTFSSHCNSWWWLRSPGENSRGATSVGTQGKSDYIYETYSTKGGVRPALKFNPKNENEECKHNYVLEVTEPTCIEQGYTTYTCTSCGDTYTSDYVDALGHTAGDIIEENYVAPTCTANGSKDNVTYCAVCNAETSRDTITVPSFGHTEEEFPAVAPTCTDAGLTTGVKCSVCDEILEPQQKIPPLGHDNIIDEAISPDCTNTGLTAGEHCSRCDYKVEQTVVDALGHKYDSVITAPTCTSQGYTTYTCHCGDTYTGDYVDSLAHNYKDGICTDCETPDPSYFTFEIQQPSRNTIRCNDGIKLHTKITGNLPDGLRIEWSKNNNNFNMSTSASGNEITIISKNNGYTTFTATVYDADNNVIAQDTIEMYSKAGLFDKIGGFFRSLFGTTKIYEN